MNFWHWLWLAICFCAHLATVTMVTLEDAEISDDLTCYTCTEVNTNNWCNRYALDRPCSSGADFCQTVHKMDGTGNTISVTKRCASSLDCTKESVGCTTTDDDVDGSKQTCISCCDISYCNDFVPTNSSTAVYLTTKSNGSKSYVKDNKNVLLQWLTLLLLLVHSQRDDIWSVLLYKIS